jgi:hypothetical protein
MLPVLLALALQAGPATPGPGPSPPPPAEGPVIIFLIDNSASVPPLDPHETRVVALEKMLGYVRGRRHRLILFGGESEMSVDDVERYRSEGKWTDFYHAFLEAREIASSYEKGTDVRMVLLTDAIVDPDPADWPDLPPGEDLKAFSIRKTVALLREMGLPLYVVLVGAAPEEGVVGGDREQSPGFVLDMVRAANGAAAAPFAQTVASFFADDGVLLRKFVYRVEPDEGLETLEPAVRRISAPTRPGIELRIFGTFVLPLLLILLALLGLLVHSFPGPGDGEVLELAFDQPVHVGVDRVHRTRHGGWAAQGLSLVADPRGAAATFTLQRPRADFSGAGLDTADLTPADAALLPLGLDELKARIETLTESGSREEKIHALNLDYMARSMSASEVERILAAPPAERARVPGLDFLRAKTHLAFDDALRSRLLAGRVQVHTYGLDAGRQDAGAGATVRVGRYRFRIAALEPGGRRDARLVLDYDRVPSLFGLKTLLPDGFQRLFRFRRSRQRVVS